MSRCRPWTAMPPGGEVSRRYAPKVKKTASLLAVLVLLTACGGSGDEKTAAENISAGIAEGDSPLEQDEADCFGDKLVDAVGVDDLKKYGILDDDLGYGEEIGTMSMDEGDAQAAADAFVDCVDIESRLSEMATESGEQLDCIKEKLDDDTYRALMKATFMSDQEAMAAAMQPIQECQLVGLPSESPTP